MKFGNYCQKVQNQKCTAERSDKGDNAGYCSADNQDSEHCLMRGIFCCYLLGAVIYAKGVMGEGVGTYFHKQGEVNLSQVLHLLVSSKQPKNKNTYFGG